MACKHCGTITLFSDTCSDCENAVLGVQTSCEECNGRGIDIDGRECQYCDGVGHTVSLQI